MLNSQEIKVIRYDDIVSTNSIALEIGEQGADHGTVIVAIKQSGGRGRRARKFSSPPGGLYFSIILRLEYDPEHVSFLTLASGVACCKTVEKISGLPVMLKWPNDLYIGSRKFGGILTESAPFSNVDQKIPFLVVGIGLNINTHPEMFPDSLQESITSLYYVQEQCYDLESIMTDVVLLLVRYAGNLENRRDEIGVFWQQRDYLYGKKISWHGVQGDVVYGTGAGLLRDGRYQLQKENGAILPILGGRLNLI